MQSGDEDRGRAAAPGRAARRSQATHHGTGCPPPGHPVPKTWSAIPPVVPDGVADRSLECMARRHLLPIAITSVAGVAAAVATMLLLSGGGRSVDGEFVLDEPGIFEQPVDDVNADTSGRALPDVALSDVTGAEVALSEYRGAPLVVNFWFSRCAPCRRELRDFAASHDEFGDRIQYVGVDPFDTVDAMERFAEDRGVTYDLLRDVGEYSDDVLLSDELGIVGYPVTLFVDAEGHILRQTGEIDAAELGAAIEELF